METEEGMKRGLQRVVEVRLDKLYGLWNELGLDEAHKMSRNQTIQKHFEELLDEMVAEEFRAKEKILASLEMHTRQAVKLSKELGMNYEMPDSGLVLVKYEQAVRHEANRLAEIREKRMREVSLLKRQDEELCDRLQLDPFYLSSSVVPTTEQMNSLKEHIRSLETEKFTREEQLIKLKENILKLYEELEAEPVTELEREVACEDTDRICLSSANLGAVADIQSQLEEKRSVNQRLVMEAVERLDSLYDRLNLDINDKFQFLADCQGCSPSVIKKLKTEIERLEEVKRANIGKFVITLRNELHKLWDDCFYSQDQRNAFTPLHSVNFTEDLLEEHEAEVKRLKKHFTENADLFTRVGQWQQVWKKFMELESRAKDPSRLMKAKGNSLLMEEKERKMVNKTLPRLQQELHELIQAWESEHNTQFLVGGVSFTDFLENKNEEHAAQLEAEKLAREQTKKKVLHQETMYGAKPATPAKLKHSTNSTSSIKTPKKVPGTPGSTFMRSRLGAPTLATIYSPRAGRIAKGTSPRVGAKGTTKGATAKDKAKLKRGVLADQTNNSLVNNDTVIKTRAGANLSVASTIPDYADFKRGTPLNSTVKMTPELPNYMTPTKAANNRTGGFFRTPTGPPARSRLGTPTNSAKSLTRLRSGKALPFLF